MPSTEAPKPTLLVVGTGIVGSALVEILRSAKPASELSTLSIFGIANTRGLAVSFEDLPRILSLPDREPPRPIDDATLDALAKHPSPVLVDATASSDIAELYVRARSRGIAIVSANKKPFAGAFAERARIFAAGSAPLRYSATVGAGLPIIDTLKKLVRTGDHVRRIDCVLSGTLGFVTNELDRGTPFSHALAIAKERGYTEPDPREDLGGKDVARKLTILARELGFETSLEDIALEPFVPASTPIDAALDRELAARVKRLAARDEKLVYLARIDVTRDGVLTASAGPTAVSRTHPASSLPSSSALASFTTARQGDAPIVISGAGAGGAVTAAALVADIQEVATKGGF